MAHTVLLMYALNHVSACVLLMYRKQFIRVHTWLVGYISTSIFDLLEVASQLPPV